MGIFSRKISKNKAKEVDSLLEKSKGYADAANKAVNPEVFFRNYDALEAALLELTAYEKYRIFRGNTPSRDLLRIQENRKNETNAMIQRSFLHAKEKAAKAGQALNGDIMRGYFSHMGTFGGKLDKFNKKVLEDLETMTLEGGNADNKSAGE